MEKILCAAIWFKDGKDPDLFSPINITEGFVISGWRHGAIMRIGDRLNISPKNSVQGFLTSENRFLDRKEARELAVTTGQCKPEFPDELYSEDLY